MLSAVATLTLATTFWFIPPTEPPVTTPPPLTAKSAPTNVSARVWAIQRPSRGTHARVVSAAARIPDRLLPWAKCVARRESGAHLPNPESRADARNGSSSAQGRWQMLKAWQRGGSYMVRDRLVRFGMPKDRASDVREWLADHEIARWSGWYQDMLFIEAVQRGGAHHWSGHTCGLPKNGGK